MERPVVFPWFPFLLFMWLSSASAQNEVVYVKLGGTISLKPDSSGPFTSILWKHYSDLVAVRVDNDLDYYGKFVGRTTLNTTTGGLVIKDTTEAFAGLYTVETNIWVQPKGYDVKLIKNVTKPEVGVTPLACSLELDNCTLVCLHDESSAFGPLTYSWREDGGDWEDGDKNKIIVNGKKNQGVKNFTCLVRNPLSEAESDTYDKPILPTCEPIQPTTLYLAFRDLVVMTVLGLSGYFMWRKQEILRKLVCPRQDREKKVKYEGPCTVYVL